MVKDCQTGFSVFLITSVLWQMVNLPAKQPDIRPLEGGVEAHLYCSHCLQNDYPASLLCGVPRLCRGTSSGLGFICTSVSGGHDRFADWVLLLPNIPSEAERRRRKFIISQNWDKPRRMARYNLGMESCESENLIRLRNKRNIYWSGHLSLPAKRQIK